MSLIGGDHEICFSHLRSLNFHFLDTWVIECVNFYKSVQPNISSEELKKQVAQQWLLINLRDMKVPSLPPDLKSKHSITLNGKYAIQVESMLDSSQSSYSQFQKLRQVDTGDVEICEEPKDREIKSSRCLIFDVSDGVQELKAMEYHPISKIKSNDLKLPPGFKMVVIGPVECRKGMIMLRDENVRLCGGEISSLSSTNNLKSILIKRLELDEANYKDEPNADKENETLPENQIKDLLSENDDLFLNWPLNIEMLVETHAGSDTGLHQEEPQQYSVSNKRRSPPFNNENICKQKKLHPDIEKQFEREMEMECGMTSEALQHDIPMEIFIDDDIMEPSKPKKPVQTKLSSYFKKCETIGPRIGHQVNSEPFVYLKQILSINFKTTKTFKIKAMILTLKKKITIKNDEFSLRATITDGSASVDVDILSSILEEILAFSPSEMVEMIKAKQKNSAIAQRVKESFSKAQEKLITLNCLMEIRIFPDGTVPIVASLEEVTMQHLTSLKERRIKGL